jgi:hypothetical protein
MRARRQSWSGVLAGAREPLARLAAALVALVVLVGVLRAGASYVYCPIMQQITEASCCAGDRDSDDDATGAPIAEVGAEVRSRDCCEHHVLGKLPKTAAASFPTPLLATPLVAVLPAPSVELVAVVSNPTAHFEHEGRAGPRAAARHRAELMVSLS